MAAVGDDFFQNFCRPDFDEVGLSISKAGKNRKDKEQRGF